jgi:hypothetical protein
MSDFLGPYLRSPDTGLRTSNLLFKSVVAMARKGSGHAKASGAGAAVQAGSVTDGAFVLAHAVAGAAAGGNAVAAK